MSDNLAVTTDIIDINRIALLLSQEFRRYKDGFDESPIPESQQSRGLFIAWIATFLPEAVSQEFVSELETYAYDARDMGDYQYEGWWRILPLDIALYALTGDSKWLLTAMTNIDHHKSDFRRLAFEALALAADRLKADDSQFSSRVASNLEKHHFFSDQAVALFVAAKGEPSVKLKLLTKWHALYKDTVADDMIRALCEGRGYDNPFSGMMICLHQYVCLRLMQSLSETSLSFARDKGVPQLQLTLNSQESLGNVLWRRLRAHPLSSAAIGVPSVENKKAGTL